MGPETQQVERVARMRWIVEKLQGCVMMHSGAALCWGWSGVTAASRSQDKMSHARLTQSCLVRHRSLSRSVVWQQVRTGVGRQSESHECFMALLQHTTNIASG